MAAEESIIVEIQDPSLQQRLDALPGQAMDPQNFTMHRIPSYIRESRQIYLEPRILSIGPFHHGKPHLQGMEDVKVLYLRDFLSRSNTALQSYLSVLKMQLPRVRSCYFESIYQFGDEKLAELLLLDGCFILEFLFKYMRGKNIFAGVGWMLPHIRSDLLKLENQIPFFVLQSLFDLVNYNNDVIHEMPSLVEITVRYLMKKKVEKSGSVAHTDIYHLLHLYHHFYVSKPDLPGLDKKPLFLGLHKALKFVAAGKTAVAYFQKRNEGSITERTPRTVPSATELQEFGVKFKKKDTTNLLDVTFKNGILEIPFLSIENSTKSHMLNLVAFEQCMPSKMRFLSTYVGFMDYIVDTPKDISILRRSGILENKLASDEEAAAFFNQLADFAYSDSERHYLVGLYKEVNKHCSSTWNEWRAKLMRDYFSNPWALLSLGAAVVLLILTFLQTFFAVFGYYRPPGS